MGTYGLEIAHDADDIVISECEALDIEHRGGKPGAYQRIADIVHIDESADMHVIRISLGRLAQLFQGIRAEGAEHDKAAAIQHAMTFLKGLVEIIAPLHGQVGPDQVYALRG